MGKSIAVAALVDLPSLGAVTRIETGDGAEGAGKDGEGEDASPELDTPR